MKSNPLTAVYILVFLLLLAFLFCLMQPAEAQPPEPTPDPIYLHQVYIPLVTNYTYPWETFTDIGSIATYNGFNGHAGRAVVAGYQTMFITGIRSDGTAQAEIWLCKWPDLETPVWVIATLDARVYDGEWLQVAIPWDLWYGAGDWLVVYGTGKYQGLLAAAEFVKPWGWWR